MNKTSDKNDQKADRQIFVTRDALTHMLSYISGKTVDLGAGTAKYKSLILPRTSEYITFDIAPHAAIDIVGDIEHTPFKDEEFDTVVSTQVLEHVRRPWLVVKEMHRILKPGGTVVLTAPFLVQHHGHPDDYFRYTTSGIKSLFEDQDFEVVESSAYGKLHAVFAEMFHFSYFNPYDKPLSRVRRKILSISQHVFRALDKRSRSQTIYANVYIIARKR